MKKMIVIVVLLFTIPAYAEDTQLDPVTVVKQLYKMTKQNYASDASYSIWGDGTVVFHLNIDRDTSLYGTGTDTRSALADLASKSNEIAKQLVPQAEQRRISALSITEGVKAILFAGKASQ